MASSPLRALVLGGLGFLGDHATRLFLERGHRVTVVTRSRGIAPRAHAALDVRVADTSTMDEAALADLLAGHDAAVFAIGADDRAVPKAPAYPYFRSANVEAGARFFRAARAAGVPHGVLLGSYFAHFHEAWPDLHLAATHPYVRSRVEQEAACFVAAGDAMTLAALRIPYVFGASPGHRPLWAPLFAYVERTPVVVYSSGGSNVVAVRAVAEAVVGAAERGAHGRFLVGDENLTWRELLLRLEGILGARAPIVTAPAPVVRLAARCVDLYHRLTGREAGLHLAPFVDVQTRCAFFDPEPARAALGIHARGLDEALRASVQAWRTGSASPPANGSTRANAALTRNERRRSAANDGRSNAIDPLGRR